MVRRILSRRDGGRGRAGHLHRGRALPGHRARLRHGRRRGGADGVPARRARRGADRLRGAGPAGRSSCWPAPSRCSGPASGRTCWRPSSSPVGLREFRPAHVAERRGGGYTVQPLARWAVHPLRAGRGERAAGARRAGRPPPPPGPLWTSCCWTGGGELSCGGTRPAGRRCWPTGRCVLRPYRRSRRRAPGRRCGAPTRPGWRRGSRRRPGAWDELNSPAAFRCVYRDQRRSARRGEGDAVRGLPARGRPGAAGRAPQPGQHRAAGVLLRRTSATGSTPGSPGGA